MYKFKWIVFKLESVFEARFDVKKARSSTILKNENLKVEWEKKREIDFFLIKYFLFPSQSFPPCCCCCCC